MGSNLVMTAFWSLWFLLAKRGPNPDNPFITRPHLSGPKSICGGFTTNTFLVGNGSAHSRLVLAKWLSSQNTGLEAKPLLKQFL